MSPLANEPLPQLLLRAVISFGCYVAPGPSKHLGTQSKRAMEKPVAAVTLVTVARVQHSM